MRPRGRGRYPGGARRATLGTRPLCGAPWRRLEPGGHLGPGDLVTEELTPDAALRALMRAEVADAVHPQTAGSFVLFGACRGAQGERGGVELLVTGPSSGQVQQGVGGTGGDRGNLAHQFQLSGRELALVQGLGEHRIGCRSLGSGQAPLGGCRRGARQRAQPVTGRAMPGFGIRAGLDDHRGEESDARSNRSFGLGQKTNHGTGFVARERSGRGTTHEPLDGVHGTLQFGTRRCGRNTRRSRCRSRRR
jgi:hypothetical protein